MVGGSSSESRVQVGNSEWWFSNCDIIMAHSLSLEGVDCQCKHALGTPGPATQHPVLGSNASSRSRS